MKIPGYEILCPKSWFVTGHARVAVYVKKGFKYQQVLELQDDELQSIWIKGGYANNKSIMFGHVYREHMTGQSVAQQEAYMDKFLGQWEAACEF